MYFNDPHGRNWFSCVIKTSLRSHDVRGSSCVIVCGMRNIYSTLTYVRAVDSILLHFRKSIVFIDDEIILINRATNKEVLSQFFINVNIIICYNILQ